MNPTGKHDRLHFAHLPTPLEPMDRLGRHLGGPHLFVKRDDCTGLAGGGGSARKLEFLMAEAIARGAEVVISGGPVLSSHARQTAAIAAKLSMQCALVLEDRAESDDEFYSGSGNLLLDRLYGAEIYRFPRGFDLECTTQDLADRYRSAGTRPYVIPSGGSSPVGALGFVNCAFEIASQLREQGLRIDRVVHATDSGGAQAGLIVGFQLAEVKIPVLGIGIALPREAQEARVYDLVGRLSDLLEMPRIPPRADVVVDSDVIENVYGVPIAPAPATLSAVTTVARHEGILLDPMGTGKAMARLIELIKARHFGRNENILFLHTGGQVGSFGCIAHIDGFLTHRSPGKPGAADAGSSA